MFFNKKKSGKIITTITKTGSRLEHEKRVREAAYDQACICPVCKHENKLHYIHQVTDTGSAIINYYEGECEECKSTWITEFKY